MGAWSFDIMGGDTPLDGMGYIGDILGIDNEEVYLTEYDESGNIARLLNEKSGLILEFVENSEVNEYALVWAYLIMLHGADMSDTNRGKFIEACDKDDWNDAGRLVVINNFRDTIREYRGKPQPLTSQGLLEVVAEHIATGESGLVNKNKPL